MSNAAEYDFSSVGDTLPTLRERERISTVKVVTKINIRTPLSLGYGSDGLFIMNKDMSAAMADNLKNLLLTNRGERAMNPSFGANLKTLLTEANSSDPSEGRKSLIFLANPIFFFFFLSK